MSSSGGTAPLGRWFPVLPPLAVAALFWWFDQPERAWVLVAVAVVVAVLIAAGVPVARYVERFAHWLAHGLSVVLGVAVGLLLVASGWLLKLVGRDPLTPRRDRHNEWHRAAGRDDGIRLATSTFGLEGRSGARPGEPTWRIALRSGVFAVGVVAALVLVDLGIGLTWERLTGSGAPLESVQTRMNFTGDQETVADVRASLPAMAAYPWADAYFREIQRTPYGYWPFTESRPLGFDGEFVNLEGWSRRTYEPADLPADAPVVWMFGGSTTWGEGQRDEYTIASYLARIAEEEGTPIRVVNYGQRGWTHFQEMILFEQLLAANPPPDVAIFYDGANEINAQTLGAKGVPTHTLADQYARILAGSSIQPSDDDGGAAPPSAASTAWTAYAGHSATGKLLRWLRSGLDQPAGASTVQEGGSGSDRQDGEDLGTFYEKSVEDAARAVDVYERGRRLTEFLGDQAGVRTIFFWQPQMAGPAEVWANDNVSDPTINISDALDATPEVYIDGGHTNEEGARLVAERIWPDLRLQLAERTGGRVPAGAAREPSSAGAGAPTPAAMIGGLESTFDQVAAEQCDLGTWSAQLGAVRATTPDEVERVASLASRFLTVLAERGSPEVEADRRVLSLAALGVLDQASDGSIDPDRAFLRQLPVAQDEAFVAAVQAVLADVTTQPGCTP
ncbi:MAG: SGNH/GDSL hydrolase family protein [Microthrixaceae bacterium]